MHTSSTPGFHFDALPPLILALVVATLVGSLPWHAAALENGLARTPQMGWNSWNHFGCSVSEQTVLAAARALVSTGLKSVGYQCEQLLPSRRLQLADLRLNGSRDVSLLLPSDVLVDDCESSRGVGLR